MRDMPFTFFFGREGGGGRHRFGTWTTEGVGGGCALHLETWTCQGSRDGRDMTIHVEEGGIIMADPSLCHGTLQTEKHGPLSRSPSVWTTRPRGQTRDPSGYYRKGQLNY